MKRKNKRRLGAFTLLELLIVLTLIAVVAGLTGIKTVQVLQEQRFLGEAEQVLSQLQLAEDLMLIMDTDVIFTLTQERDGVQYSLDVEKPLAGLSQRLVKEDSHISLKAIEKYQFEPSPLESKLDLVFTLGSMTRGVLTLYPFGKQDLSYRIVLHGYPRPLKGELLKAGQESKEILETDYDRFVESQTLYPKDIP